MRLLLPIAFGTRTAALAIECGMLGDIGRRRPGDRSRCFLVALALGQLVALAGLRRGEGRELRAPWREARVDLCDLRGDDVEAALAGEPERVACGEIERGRREAGQIPAAID